VSEYVRNQAHVEQGLDRLLERFKGRPKLEALLRLFLERVQRIDDVVWDLYVGMWLDNAEGAQLDALGFIVNEPRLGRADDLYRLYIRARIRINRANGRPSDVLQVARLVIEPTATLEFIPEYPAAYKVRITGTAIRAIDLKKIMLQVKPAGVGLTVDSVQDLANAFIFDTGTPLINGWDHGRWIDDV
jgi:hypothetical protein